MKKSELKAAPKQFMVKLCSCPKIIDQNCVKLNIEADCNPEQELKNRKKKTNFKNCGNKNYNLTSKNSEHKLLIPQIVKFQRKYTFNLEIKVFCFIYLFTFLPFY